MNTEIGKHLIELLWSGNEILIKLPELGLELGLAELKLAYFRCLLAGGDLIL